MNPANTLTHPDLEVQAERMYVERRRGLAKVANLIRDYSGIVIGRVVGIGNEVLPEEPSLAEIPTPGTEVPAPATEVTEDPSTWSYSGADKVAAAKSSGRWGRVEAAQEAFRKSDEATPVATAADAPEVSNESVSDHTQPQGLARRTKGATDINKEFRHGTANSNENSNEAAPEVETADAEQATAITSIQVTASGLPRRRPGSAEQSEIEKDPLGVGEVYSDEQPTPTFVAALKSVGNPLQAAASQDIASIPVAPVTKPTMESTPIAKEVATKHFNEIDMRLDAKYAAEDAASKMITDKSAEGAVMGRVFVTNQDPLRLT